jgi:hypothetical protein
MGFIKKYLLAVLGAAALTLYPLSAKHSHEPHNHHVKSDYQAYPGVQLRVQQPFVDLATEELFYVLPHIVNDVLLPLIPTQFKLFFGIVNIHNIYARDFAIDASRGYFALPVQLQR